MKAYSVMSPGGTVCVSVFLADGQLLWRAEKDGVPLSGDAPLGFLDGPAAQEAVFVRDVAYGGIDDTYTLPAYKKARCRDHAGTMELTCAWGSSLLRVQARAYDDGAAIRVIGEGMQRPATGERTAFQVPDGARNIWAMKYLFSYEDQYHLVPREELGQNLYAFPVLLELQAGMWALYTEAAVFGDYGASHLAPDAAGPGMLRVRRAPDGPEPIAETVATPWRVVLAGSLDDIVSSNVLENLNPPSIVADTGFIRGGRAAWSWMSEDGAHRDPVKSREYVDFAAEMGFEYYLADGNWDQTIDMPALVAYGAERGVGIWVWAHSADMRDPAVAEEKLARWAAWGVVGVKIDFFESDKPSRIAQYDMLARLCAKHRLMINFHGCTKPAGEIRTYPHVLTREGVMGGEYFRNYSTFLPFGPDAMHNCTLPFTRNAIGPMDYTPVVYRTYPTGTSDAHQTALAVIFTSYVQNYGGNMREILDNPCREMLKRIPATWDESRLLEGYPGSHVTMAREKDGIWYLAGICAHRPRAARLALDFLPEGRYTAHLCTDDFVDRLSFDGPIGAVAEPDAAMCRALDGMRKRPEHHSHNLQLTKFDRIDVKKGDILQVPMVAGGGFVAILTPSEAMA